MTGDHCFRIQGLDFVQRPEPLVRSLVVALREIEMRVVVDAISRYDQTDGRHMQRKFSALALVCWLYVGMQSLSPGADIGFDLSKEYQMAKAMLPERP